MRLHEIPSKIPQKLWSAPRIAVARHSLSRERRRRARRLGWKWRLLLLFLVVLGLLVFGVWGPVFRVRSVEVGGAGELGPVVTEFILEYIESEKSFGFLPQKSLITLDMDTLSGQLESKFVQIKSVRRANLDWPSGLGIELEFRNPTFVVENANQRLVLGQDGKVLRQVALEEQLDPNLTLLQWPIDVDIFLGDGFRENIVGVYLDALRTGLLDAGSQRVISLRLLPDAFLLPPPEFAQTEPSMDAKNHEQTARALEKGEEQSVNDAKNPKPLFRTEAKLSGEVVADVSLPDDGGRFFVLVRMDSKTADEFSRQMKLFLNQQTKDRLKKVMYLDMRYDDRGYLCLKEAACSKDLPWQLTWK